MTGFLEICTSKTWFQLVIIVFLKLKIYLADKYKKKKTIHTSLGRLKAGRQLSYSVWNHIIKWLDYDEPNSRCDFAIGGWISYEGWLLSF